MKNIGMSEAGMPSSEKNHGEEGEKVLPSEAKEVIESIRRHKFYEEDFAELAPGAMPSREMATKLICSIVMNEERVLPLDSARTLMDCLDFDMDEVAHAAISKIVDERLVDERRLKAIEMAGVDIDSLRDKATAELPRLIWAVKNGTRTDEELQEWKKVFAISEQEFEEAAAKVKSGSNSV